MKKNAICIIPARSGSKRIPLKNIKKINNIHLIGHVIKNLKSSSIFRDIFVSTDSIKIKNISNKYGAKVPFLRSKKLSNDKTPVIQVIEDALRRIDLDYQFDYVCYIFPTSIFVKKKYIIKLYKQFVKSNADHFMVIKKFNHPIDRALYFQNKNILPVNFKKFVSGTQKFKSYFYDTGQIYFAKKNSVINKKKLFKSKVECYIEKNEVIDIDNLDDFVKAKKKFHNEKKK